MDEAIVKLVMRKNTRNFSSMEQWFSSRLFRGRKSSRNTTLLHLEEDMPWMDERNPTFIQALHASKETLSPGGKSSGFIRHFTLVNRYSGRQREHKISKVDIRISRHVSLNNSELNSTNLVLNHIETGDVNPIHQLSHLHSVRKWTK